MFSRYIYMSLQLQYRRQLNDCVRYRFTDEGVQVRIDAVDYDPFWGRANAAASSILVYLPMKDGRCVSAECVISDSRFVLPGSVPTIWYSIGFARSDTTAYTDVDEQSSPEFRTVAHAIEDIDMWVREHFPGYCVIRRESDVFDRSLAWVTSELFNIRFLLCEQDLFLRECGIRDVRMDDWAPVEKAELRGDLARTSEKDGLWDMYNEAVSRRNELLSRVPFEVLFPK